MAFIFPIINQPSVGIAPQMENADTQLGTEESGFSGLLGLQEAESGFQEKVDGETFDLLAQLTGTEIANGQANPFGQDAALPIAADDALANLGDTRPSAASALTSDLSALFDPSKLYQNQSSEPNAWDTLPRETLSSGNKESAAGLTPYDLSAPIENLEPHELRKLVDSVWADVIQEAKYEDIPVSSHVDSSQHALLKLMAARAEQKANQATASMPLPAEVQTAGEQNTPLASEIRASEDTLTGKSERKAAQPGSGLPTPTAERVSESVDTFQESAAKKDLGNNVAQSKLMPQVLPRMESLIQQGGGKLTMQLDPPELGKLTIELTTRGKNVEVAIHSDNQSTRAALEGAMADLQQALQSHDLQLTRAEVHGTRESSFASMQFGQGANHQEQTSRDRQSSYEGQEKQRTRDFFNEALPVTRSRNAGRLDVRV